MKNSALLRRISLAAMLVAVVTGTVSLYMLFTKPTDNKSLFIISVVALAVGMLLDHRASKLEDRDVR